MSCFAETKVREGTRDSKRDSNSGEKALSGMSVHLRVPDGLVAASNDLPLFHKEVLIVGLFPILKDT